MEEEQEGGIRMHPALKPFETFIKQNYSGILSISPMDSLTPFEVEMVGTNKSEFLFICKASPYLYAPLKELDMLNQKETIRLTMYNEGTSLIVCFEVKDLTLEAVITQDGIRHFLEILKEQEKITLAVVDGNTYDLVWLTNTIPFRTIRFHYAEIFQLYGVM